MAKLCVVAGLEFLAITCQISAKAQLKQLYSKTEIQLRPGTCYNIACVPYRVSNPEIEFLRYVYTGPKRNGTESKRTVSVPVHMELFGRGPVSALL